MVASRISAILDTIPVFIPGRDALIRNKARRDDRKTWRILQR
jgi:hypothetical protein